MFERFGCEARDCISAAAHIDRETASRGIDTRHLLLALIDRNGPAAALSHIGAAPAPLRATLLAELGTGELDADALARLGIDLATVRERTDAVFGNRRPRLRRPQPQSHPLQDRREEGPPARPARGAAPEEQDD